VTQVIDRRAVLVAMAGGMIAGPLTAIAQPSNAPPLIGFLPLGSASSGYDRSLVEAFRQGLRDEGIVENRDVVLDVVWTGSEVEVSRAVINFAQRGAKLLIPAGTTASMTVARQAPGMPMLFISVGNPLGIGLVSSLSRPGGHVTGFADSLAELSSKYVQFATEVGRPPGVLYYVWHTGWTDGHYRYQKTEEAVRSLGLKLVARAIKDLSDLDEAMATMKKSGATVVIIQPSPFTFRERERVIASAMTYRLATIFAFRDAARAGAMITYGPDYADLNRRAATYVARIVRGARPGDLPVEQPTKFEFLLNRKTAKALGVTIPPALLLQADPVID
jgi:putative ABC transport system substrate-binding protein